MADLLTRRPQRVAAGALGAALAAALGACGSDGPTTSPASPSPGTVSSSAGPTTAGGTESSTSAATTSSTATGATATGANAGGSSGRAVDACSLLTDAEVNTAGSQPFTEKKPATVPTPGESVCYWNAGNRTVVTVKVTTDPALAKKTYEEGRRGLFYDDKSPGPAIGTGAYWRLAGPSTGPTLRFMQGTRLVSVANDNPEGGGLSRSDEAGLRTKVEVLGRVASTRLG